MPGEDVFLTRAKFDLQNSPPEDIWNPEFDDYADIRLARRVW